MDPKFIGNYSAKITNNNHPELQKRRINWRLNAAIDEQEHVYVYDFESELLDLPEVRWEFSCIDDAKKYLTLTGRIYSDIKQIFINSHNKNN